METMTEEDSVAAWRVRERWAECRAAMVGARPMARWGSGCVGRQGRGGGGGGGVWMEVWGMVLRVMGEEGLRGREGGEVLNARVVIVVVGLKRSARRGRWWMEIVAIARLLIVEIGVV